MKANNVTRRFTKIIAVFAAFVLLMWTVFHFTVSAHNEAVLDATGGMAINTILSSLNDEFSDMSAVASVMSGSASMRDFLLETDVSARYLKAETVSEIIDSTAYSRIDIDSIITIAANGSYHRFTGSAGREGLETLAANAADGLPVYSTVELDGRSYFCLSTPVYRGSASNRSMLGYIVILSDVEKIRRALAGSSTVSGIDTALILGDTVLVAGKPEFDGQSIAVLEDNYGSVRSATVSGTNLYAVAGITQDALKYSGRMLFIISIVALAALLVTICLLHRVLRAFTVIPMLQRADHMKSGLLRTQIDAHFVVNTMDCIAKLIAQGKCGEAGAAAENLTALITKLHEGGDEPNIMDEMDALTRYIEIVNIRSGGKYDADVDIDDELSAYRMPARVLQPLVENAVHHAFAGMDKDCRLTVTGRIMNNGVVFEVTDNGRGLAPGQIKGLQEMLDTADDWDYDEYRLKGVALLNIQKRIRVRYGGGFGLAVRGRPGRGLTFLVRLPLIEDRERKPEE